MGHDMQSPHSTRYCESYWYPARRPTHGVQVHQVEIGGRSPVRLQSMTTSRGDDLEGSVKQALAIAHAGGDLVRITTPTLAQARGLEQVVKVLRAQGCMVPIVADVHFTPKVALMAARFADKVRVNPGNFGLAAQQLEWSPREAQARLLDDLRPLLEVCKLRRIPLRIGVNHGSLSPRIMASYGAGPAGMVASATEMLALCLAEGFDQVVVSLKASTPRLMVVANRLFSVEQYRRGWTFPLHLGVTEAGNALQGRVKSAAGIGALLADGLGDTIRVSLTEPPEREIPVAKHLVDYIASWPRPTHTPCYPASLPYDPLAPQKPSWTGHRLYAQRPHGWLLKRLSQWPEKATENLLALGFQHDGQGNWRATGRSVDLVLLPGQAEAARIPQSLWDAFAVPDDETRKSYRALSGLWRLHVISLDGHPLALPTTPDPRRDILYLESHEPGIAAFRRAAILLGAQGIRLPIVAGYGVEVPFDPEWYSVETAAAYGALMVDYLAWGLALPASALVLREQVQTGLTILQSLQMRQTEADLIACPGCGRTLYDLPTTLAKVRAATCHLKHLKIAVMGCIVNGPGEMADADYGYVGAGPGKISLYKGRELKVQNIPTEQAVPQLIALIKREGDWVEPL